MSLISDTRGDKFQKKTLWIVLLNAVSTAMMLTGVNVALPAIADDLSVGASTLSWIPMSYLISSAIFVLIFGQLADIFGRKKLFLLGTLGVVVSSIYASVATDVQTLILGRIFQGVCAGMLYSTMFALLSSVYPTDRRGLAFGYAVSAVYLGLSLGPFVAGWMIDILSWRSAFLLQLPLSFFVLYIGVVEIKTEWKAKKKIFFDYVGSTLFALFILSNSMMILYQGWVFLLSFGFLSFLFLIGFFKHEKKVVNPVFDVHSFLSSRIFSMSCLSSMLMYTATFSTLVSLSLYFQFIKEISARDAGLFLMVQPLTMAIFSPYAGRLSDRLEPRVLATSGIMLTAIGLFVLSRLGFNSSICTPIAALFVIGFGFSLFSSPNANAIMGSVGGDDYGRAAGAMSVMRVLGQMGSMALMTFVVNIFLGDQQITPLLYPQLLKVLQLVFSLGCVLCLVGSFLSYSRGQMHTEAA